MSRALKMMQHNYDFLGLTGHGLYSVVEDARIQNQMVTAHKQPSSNYAAARRTVRMPFATVMKVELVISLNDLSMKWSLRLAARKARDHPGPVAYVTNECK